MKRRGRPKKELQFSRESILESAIELLKGSNHATLSMRGLASRLNVTPMALYNHFPDRESLIREMSDVIYARVVSTFEEQGGSTQSKVKTLLTLYYSAVTELPGMAMLVFNSKSQFSSEIQKINDHLLKLLSDLGFTPAKSKMWRDILVDFTHGSAIATASSSEFSKTFMRMQKERYAVSLSALLAAMRD